MKVIIADTYCFYLHNSRNTQFPREYKRHKIIWNMREALMAIWQGGIEELVIPKLGTPGYDFPGFIQNLVDSGQLSSKPKIKYYELNIVKKS